MNLQAATKERIKDIFGSAGILLAFGYTILMYITFLFAFFSSDKSVTIFINRMNEAMAEFFILPILLVIVIWGVYWYFHEAIFEPGE